MDALLEKERQLRLSKDEQAMTELMQLIISKCTNNIELLTYVKILSKRKAQLKTPLKTVITDLYLKKTQDYYNNINREDDFISFSIDLLDQVIVGKFFFEEERILIVNTLKKIYEDKGMISHALEIIYNVPIETYSSISEKDKVHFLLEVIRLSVNDSQFSKSEIVGKRIRLDYFKEGGDSEGEKLYYKFMVNCYLGQRKFEKSMNFFKKLIKICDLTNEEGNFKNVEMCSFISIITNMNDDRNEMMHFCYEHKDNTDNMRNLLKIFKSNNIINRENTINEFYIKNDTEFYLGYKNDFISAIDTHNLMIVSKFFTRLNLTDLINIMGCSLDECLDKICYMVNHGMLRCKIDQERNLLVFEVKEEIENEKSISDVLDKLIKIDYMIEKENLKFNK